MARETLNEESVTGWLTRREGWSRSDAGLVKEYRFDGFRDAVIFANRVATVADETGHYPEIRIRAESVRLAVGSGKRGSLTERDLDLAEKIDLATPRR